MGIAGLCLVGTVATRHGAGATPRLRPSTIVFAAVLAVGCSSVATPSFDAESPDSGGTNTDGMVLSDALHGGDIGAADGAAADAGAADIGTPDSGPSDSGPSDSGAADSAATDAGSPSRCTASPSQISCPYQTLTLATGFLGFATRDVHAQVPLGTPPKAGWPVAIFFQGSFFSAKLSWQATPAAKIGLFHLVATVKALLDAGYAVLTPEAHLQGATFWDTNILPYSVLWFTSPDHAFMLAIFKAIKAGSFGPLDSQRLHALGISSGGYMTSRMALSYPGQFRSLAIHSASWATCSGPICSLPTTLPKAHPPTLFLHGEADTVVPMSTMLPYRKALTAAGVQTGLVTAKGVGHAWLAAGPTAVVGFFQQHP